MIRYFCDICNDEIQTTENKYPDMGFEFETEKLYGKLEVSLGRHKKGQKHACRECVIKEFTTWLHSQTPGHMDIAAPLIDTPTEEIPVLPTGDAGDTDDLPNMPPS